MIAQTIAETELRNHSNHHQQRPRRDAFPLSRTSLKNIFRFFGPMQKENNLGRQRVLPELALWSGLFVCILRKNFHQNDIWKLLTLCGVCGVINSIN